MKRCFALVVALILALSLAACGGKGQAPTSEPPSSQGGGEVISGGESPSEIPSSAPSNSPPDESGPPQNDGQSVIENIPQEEQWTYYKKYVYPYYLVGLLDTTWSDPEEIEVWRYMHFFTYNEDYNYYTSLGNTLYQDHSVPADVVEGYVTSYFEVDPAYLRTSEKYDAAANCYFSMANEGIGDGPGVTIERIEKNGDVWKFVCRDISDNLLSVSIRVLDGDTFHYIAGEVLERAEPTKPQVDERLEGIDLGEYANTLTEHIIFSVFEYSAIRNGECPSPTEEDMLRFTIGAAHYKDRQEYWYHDVVSQGENSIYHFPEGRIKSMVYEVFGFENWLPDKNGDPFAYDGDRKDFYSGLEFGFGNNLECWIMSTLIDTQDMKIIVDYDLYTSPDFPDQQKIATMNTEYSIRFREDDTPYLRYEGTEVSPLRDGMFVGERRP